MKNLPSRFVLAAALLAASRVAGPAQVQPMPDQVARVAGGAAAVSFSQDLPADAVISPKPGETAPPILLPKNPKVTVPRKWSEARALIHVPIENKARADLKIEGVQATGSLYVVSFPRNIPAGAKDELVVAYAADAGTDANLDLIKLLTNQGAKLIEVVQEREPVAGLEVNKLQWKVGEAPATKNIMLVLVDPAIRAKAVRVFGTGNKAELVTLGPGQYRIDVTPGSTAKRAEFPVFVDFEPALTGVPNVIVVSVVD